MRKLETLLNDFTFDSLPPTWTTFDLARFSKSKSLWGYQQTALQNAVKTLWKYYQDLGDFTPIEALKANAERKSRLMQWYLDNHVALDEYLPLAKKRDIAALLSAYYPASDLRAVSYENFINRMGFWMATGSGKTLVLVKLIQVLSGQRRYVTTRITHRLVQWAKALERVLRIEPTHPCSAARNTSVSGGDALSSD